MSQSDYSIEIHAPAEKVFAHLVNDPSQWVEMMLKSEKLTAGEHRVGTKFKDTYKVSANKTMELMGEITAYEPNKRLKVFMTSDAFDIMAEYNYKNLMMRLMSPIVNRMAQKELIRDFDPLKALAER